MNTKTVALVACLGMFSLSACADLENVFESAPSKAVTKDRYGAIAFSRTTQKWHIRWNVVSPDRAAALAIKNCGAGDCRAVLKFGPLQCGTFSLGDGGAFAVGKGKSEQIAQETAFEACAVSGQYCKVAPVQCNN